MILEDPRQAQRGDPAPAGSPPWPFVTVAIPCLDEERHVERCLRSVLAQDYPADRVEIMVADGRSRDRTREIVGRIAAEDPRVELVDNPDRLQAGGLNAIIRRARGEIVVRMDVHCSYAPDYLTRCVEVLERTGADNAGGAQRARAETPFQAVVCAALSSPLGVGGARYRSEEAEGWVDTVYLGAFRRSVLERVGLYDQGAVTNEDAELNQRILEAGGRIYLSREIVVHYLPRETPRALAVQYFRYGRGRARSLLKHGRLQTIRPLVPFLMVMGGLALVATSHLHPFAPVALAAYLAVAAAEAVRVGRGLGAAGVAAVWSVFPLLHLSHGLGFAAGLLRYLGRPDWTGPGHGEGARRGGGAAGAGAPGTEPAGLDEPGMSAPVRIAKRALDLAFSVVGLVLAAPTFALVAIAVKLDSPGPVFYRQRRAGALLGVERRDGRQFLHFVEFDMPKFRTMCHDAERLTGAVLAAKSDPRVTRVGRFLRRSRLDELPQLWSILCGDMSLVGPRPERPRLLRDIAFAIPMFEERMRGVKPGLTGFAQVNLDYAGEALPGSDIEALQSAITNPFRMEGAEGSVADGMRLKLLYDLAYSASLVDLWTYLRTELEILFKTPMVMLRGLGR